MKSVGRSLKIRPGHLAVLSACEISSHTKRCRRAPLHCPACGVQEDRFPPSRRGGASEQNALSSISIKNGHESDPVCVCVCALGQAESVQHTGHPAIRSSWQGIPGWPPSSCQTRTFSVSLTGPQGERGTKPDRKQTFAKTKLSL